ncbi:MAG TPA: hypothetical protein VF077_13370 [Nitrospiraceae bacterium]
MSENTVNIIPKLPEKFLKDGLELAENSRLFGMLFSDMTREELIASAAQGWKRENDARKEGNERAHSLLDIIKRSASCAR